MPSSSAAATINVKIYAPSSIYFDGPADSISATNDTGPFDILGHHKNFMCLLRPGEVRVRRAGKEDFVLHLRQAVMHVKFNIVTVFVDV